MNFATKWDQMSDLEQASAIWWDLYKDVHGVRPRGVDTSNWTLEGFNAQIAALSTALQEQLAEDEEEQARAVSLFESRIQDTLLAGAGNRETAVRWIMRDSGMGDDLEYTEFRFNLPFGYLRNVA
jgi:hypothetical protein